MYHIVQVAAVLGVGLVYQGTAHRHMAEVLLSQIGKSHVSHSPGGRSTGGGAGLPGYGS